MTAQPLSKTVTNPNHAQEELRAAVMDELAARKLDNPDALADRLGVLPIAAQGLLTRPIWTFETALWLVERLDLPIQVVVTRA